MLAWKIRQVDYKYRRVGGEENMKNIFEGSFKRLALGVCQVTRKLNKLSFSSVIIHCYQSKIIIFFLYFSAQIISSSQMVSEQFDSGKLSC